MKIKYAAGLRTAGRQTEAESFLSLQDNCAHFVSPVYTGSPFLQSTGDCGIQEDPHFMKKSDSVMFLHLFFAAGHGVKKHTSAIRSYV